MSPQRVQQIPINQIVVRKQVRETFDEEELAGLAQSIAENGILQPLLGHREGESVVLYKGERRLRTAKRAGLATVPVIIEDRELSGAEIVQRQLVINCQRADLSAIEKARAIDQLIRRTGLPASQVAIKVGMSPTMISNLASLLTLPPAMQDQVASGELKVSTAYELARVSDPVERARLAGEAVGQGLSRDQVVARIKTARGTTTPRAAAKRAVAALGSGRSITVSGPGLNLERLVDWLEELLAKARKVRTKGVELDTFLRLLRDEAKGARL
jgi:ParB family transcriptional regulator, chromosome partitioning protein